jgi:hypothetical protein
MDQALLAADHGHQPKTGSWNARSAVDKELTGFVSFSFRIISTSYFMMI